MTREMKAPVRIFGTQLHGSYDTRVCVVAVTAQELEIQISRVHFVLRRPRGSKKAFRLHHACLNLEFPEEWSQYEGPHSKLPVSISSSMPLWRIRIENDRPGAMLDMWITVHKGDPEIRLVRTKKVEAEDDWLT